MAAIGCVLWVAGFEALPWMHSMNPHQPARWEDYLGQMDGTCSGP
jgi:hypothetical protein